MESKKERKQMKTGSDSKWRVLIKIIILSKEGGFHGGKGSGGSDLIREDGRGEELVRDDLLTSSISKVGDRPSKLPLDGLAGIGEEVTLGRMDCPDDELGARSWLGGDGREDDGLHFGEGDLDEEVAELAMVDWAGWHGRERSFWHGGSGFWGEKF